MQKRRHLKLGEQPIVNRNRLLSVKMKHNNDTPITRQATSHSLSPLFGLNVTLQLSAFIGDVCLMFEDVALRWKWRLLPVELGVETRDDSICVTVDIDVSNSQVKITKPVKNRHTTVGTLSLESEISYYSCWQSEKRRHCIEGSTTWQSLMSL